MRFLPMRHSIGAKIFGAFVAMGIVTAALGGYGLYMLMSAGHIVADIYDRPLMAINFARAASLTFSRMDKEVIRRSMSAPPEQAKIDAKLAQLASSFFSDLDVAEQRSLGAEERRETLEIRRLVTQWDELRRNGAAAGLSPQLDRLAEAIVDHFDVLVERTAEQGFIERRKATSAIRAFEYSSIAAVVIALLLSAIITLILARWIIRPLSAAASIADRIANGGLDTPIPAGGKDEAGILLRSMSVMQHNIREAMEREAAQRHLAQIHLIDALESSREGMMLVDGNGRIVIANSQLATFFPTVVSLLSPGTPVADVFTQIRPALIWRHRAEDIEPYDDSLIADGEYQLTDGRWVRFSRSTTRDSGFILFLSDFTNIKEREESFREAKKQAETASKAKSNFLANMSHELRTPLNAIIGFSEIISGEMFGALGNERYVEYAGSILQSGKHLLEVINSVLDLAKGEAGKLQIHADPVELDAILNECAMMLREQCARAKLDLKIMLPDVPLYVLGETPKLRQICLNLLSNAIKFTEAGGRVTFSAAAPSSDIIEIAVADTGIGMTDSEIPVALAPFGQVDTRLARKYEGTGLGLPLAKSFVELHGGTMTIASRKGEGTTVSVRLPRHIPAPRRQDAPVKAVASR